MNIARPGASRRRDETGLSVTRPSHPIRVTQRALPGATVITTILPSGRHPVTQSRAQFPTQSAPPVVVQDGRRPAMVTFAAVIMFTLALFLTIAAITEWANSVWLYQRDFSVAGSHLVFWGFVDFGLAMLSAAGGYLIL